METNKIYQGSSLDTLKIFPDECIDTCVTSPPYWGLRDYGNDGQLGLEKTFEEYITKLCDIFDEVMRVLKPTGSCWVNIGDTYNSQPIGNQVDPKRKAQNGEFSYNHKKSVSKDLPIKCLCDIPFRFSIEMINRGWIKRNTIIWYKHNCMPSSASDRFTVDFEYLFFFTKNKKYYFEQQFDNAETNIERTAINGYGSGELGNKAHFGNSMQGRNKRCVWQVNTKPFKEAHFAVYPQELIRTPINACCPKDICNKCGQARKKIYNVDGETTGDKLSKVGYSTKRGQDNSRQVLDYAGTHGSNIREREFVGYSDCGCNAGFQAGVVLDPFMGSGTTAIEAITQKKDYVGIELNEEYIKIAQKRIDNTQNPLF